MTPACPLCSAPGALLHAALADRLFAAPGRRDLWRCADRAACGLGWLEPRPGGEELARAYRDYYTHATPPPASAGGARRVLESVRRGYLARRYGSPPAGFALRAAGLLAWLVPAFRADFDFAAAYTRPRPDGRLLEVGCGNGSLLLGLGALGWSVSGTDVDPGAVAAARARGLRVELGEVEALPLPAAGSDLVLLSHVIEHADRPVALLAACRRLLAPGGRLVLVTPNLDSLGHRVFGRAWRGLEPPRHLQVYTRPALLATARTAGFGAPRARATIRNARGMYRQSRAIAVAERAGAERAGEPRWSAASEAWAYAQAALNAVTGRAGEELLLIAEEAAALRSPLTPPRT